jgi:hypothetical protein
LPPVWQRALERVVLAGQRGGETREVGREHVDAAGIVRAQRRPAGDHVQGRALAGAHLRQEQRAGREVERRQAVLPRHLPAAVAPAEPPRDHQVQNEKEVVVRAQDDPLAQSLHRAHRLALDRRHRRVDRTKQERARDARALERLVDDARPEALDVDGHVRKLRHTHKW